MKTFVTWFEIPATNISRAVKFYSSLFGFDFEICDFGKEKMAFFPKKLTNVDGAISYAKDFNPSENGVLISFKTLNNLDYEINKVKELGGKIVKEKTKIEAEGRGYFALILDTEGNRIGLYQ